MSKLLALLIGLILIGCEKKESEIPNVPAIPVIAATPETKDVVFYLEAIGNLEPSLLMEIRPLVDGTLVEIFAQEGQWVDPGTPLFKIDPTLYEIKVKEAEAQLAIDQVNLIGAQKKLARIKPLAEKDLVSQAELENLEIEEERSRALLLLDQTRLKFAVHDLEQCTICSPLSGRMGKLNVHRGLFIKKNDPLVTISQMNPLIVEFKITEKEFPKIQKNSNPIQIKSLCLSDTCVNGVITFQDNHFDSTTGLLLIKGEIPNPNYLLRPGQSVQVRVPVSTQTNALLIPQKAIRFNREGPYVYVINPDMKVAERLLILGEEDGLNQIVLEGLSLEEKFIVDGHLRLSPGIKVELK